MPVEARERIVQDLTFPRGKRLALILVRKRGSSLVNQIRVWSFPTFAVGIEHP